ncbi:MAG: hypothetical protein QS2022_5730 [Candidatus Phytoplasma asteris]|uniref:Type I restriction-modification system, methyltransferase subunit n=1 Tax='Chrysanthemum coronarium' phytoplasma TaxID=1520703 RepID=A0ABQ0J2M1_9MOLU|nr:hypothetical protein ['Chrysanthemum coronarium' phytoplasma]TKA87791.1 MAG: hypothetical protein PLY_5710 [Periwinkle leaf yellowing phytoplasma]WEX19813.1 MAG: hypothetical protein QS2022_5730 [Candidatus Phytoplasma asteris]GAK73847.1 type I restriction-modification system, methyltransferase subunit ['Chrysanthemum coronarium' phytoplasma]
MDDGDFNRKRHYTLEDDQLKVDWAHKNTYDWEYNKDKLPKRKKYFNADVSVNWQFVANSKECTFDVKWTYEKGEAVSFSTVPVPEEDHAAENELQNYKLEAYKLVQEEDVVKVVNKLMADEKFQTKLQENGLQEALQETVKVLLDEEVNNLVVSPVKKLLSNTTNELLLQDDRDKKVFKDQVEELNTKEKLPKSAKKLVLQLVKEYFKEQVLENFDDEEDKGLVKAFLKNLY